MKRSRPFKGISLTSKLIMIMTCVIVCMSILISYVSWKKASEGFEQLETDRYRQVLENVCIQLKTPVNSAQNILTQVGRLTSLRQLAGTDLPNEDTLEKYDKELKRVVDELMLVSASAETAPLTFVKIFMKNGYSFSSGPGIRLDYESFDDCCSFLLNTCVPSLDGYVSSKWVDTTVQPYKSVPTRSIVGMRFIYDGITLEKVGVFVFGINESRIRSIYSLLSQDSALVRSDGYVVSGGNSTVGTKYDWPGEINTGGPLQQVSIPNGRILFSAPVFDNSLRIISVNDLATFRKSEIAADYLRTVIITCIICLCISALLIWLITKKLTHSLENLTDTVQRISEGNIHERFQSDKQDEVAYLGSKMNEMIDQTQNLYKARELDVAEKNNLELRLLQSRINPHLLYNTLNSVIWIIRQNDNQKAEALVLNLANFFKLALAKGSEIVTLSDEISMIDYYLKIQNTGRGKSFRLVVSIPEECRSRHIMRMLIEPFVENSVIHGFTDWRDDGIIELSSEDDTNCDLMIIRIRDNGIGMTPDELHHLMEDIHSTKLNAEHQHYGLYNVDRRIKNNYGTEYGIDIQSESGAFTEVSIILPLSKTL